VQINFKSSVITVVRPLIVDDKAGNK